MYTWKHLWKRRTRARAGLWFFVIIVMEFQRGASAFPELVRHGYANCIACHMAPNGGGILTPYGRQLSREVLSTWGTEGEGDFLYGAFKLPSWLNLGGDVRAIQTYQNTPQRERAQFIFMQADLEAAFTYEKFQLVGTIGRQEPSSFNFAGSETLSRRHYVAYWPQENISVRAGRFTPAYGLNIADHSVVTRRGLRWDEGGETYNVEGAYMGEKVDAFATIVFGRPEAAQLNREKGFALRGSYMLGENEKAGLSYFYGSNDSGKRHLFGPYVIFGLTHHFFILAELDFQNTLAAGGSGQWGAVDYLRVDYELTQGLHGFFTQEFSKLDFGNAKSTLNAYGLGAQFFPRPHFELEVMWQKRQLFAQTTAYTDFAWLLLHFYP